MWRVVEVPDEAPRTRLLLAEAYLAEADVETAALELKAARSTFQKPDAEPGTRRTAELLQRTATTGTRQRLNAWMSSTMDGLTI